MDEYLWPARNVAEFAYCPRLFYFMEVEGVYLPSTDTEQGNAVHKRVHKAGAAAADEALDPNKPRAVRSLTLSSRVLGLTATLDLAEIEGRTAVPVEYRKGRPKLVASAPEPEAADLDDPAPARVEPWPTDRVQVGLQAILLKEDQALILDLGPNEQTARAAATVLGPALPQTKGGVMVI